MLKNTQIANTLDQVFSSLHRLLEACKDPLLAEQLAQQLMQQRREIQQLLAPHTGQLSDGGQYLFSMAEAAPVAARVLDTSGHPVYFNQHWLGFTGHSGSQNPETTWAAALHPADLEKTKAALQQGIERQQKFELEYRLYRYDGVYHRVVDKGQPIYQNDHLTGFVVWSLDVQESRETEEKLRQRDAYLHEIQRIGKIASFEWNLETDLIQWSREFFDIAGRTTRQCACNLMTFMELLHPDDRSVTEESIINAIWQRKRPYFEYRLLLPDGNIKYIASEAEVEYQGDLPVRMIGLIHDITEGRQTEERLRNSEARLRETQRIARIGSWEYYPDADQLICSEETYRIHEMPEGSDLLKDPQVRHLYTRCLRCGDTGSDQTGCDFDTSISLANGSEKYIHVIVKVLRDSQGRIVKRYGAVMDITERKQAEQKLINSESLHRTLCENFPNGVIMLFNRELRTTFIEGSELQRLGVSSDMITGLMMRDTSPPGEAAKMEHYVGEAFQGKSSHFEIQYGEDVYSMIALPLRDHEGKISQVMGVSQRITEQKQITERLRRSEQLYKTIASNFPDGSLAIFDRDLILRFIDGQELTRHQVKPEQYIGRPVQELVPADKLEMYRQYYFRALGGEQVSFEDYLFNSCFHYTILPLRDEQNTISNILVVTVNITAYREAQERIRQSEKLYRTMAQNLPNGFIALISKDYRIFFAEGKELAEIGLLPEVIINQPLEKIFDAPLAAAMHTQFAESFQGKSVVKEIEYAGQNYLHSTVPLYDEYGQIQYVMAVSHNITPMRVAQESTLRYARKSIAILESITDAMVSLDREWNIVYVNGEAERLLQISRDELLDRNIWDAFDKEVHSEFYQAYQKATTENVAVDFEAWYAALNLWLELHAYPSAEGLSIYFRDITGRKQAEARLTHRLELEKLLSSISTQFINVDINDLEEGITDALARIGRFTGADYAMVNIFPGNLSITRKDFYEWSDHQQVDDWCDFISATAPWWREHLASLEPLYISRAEAWPPYHHILLSLPTAGSLLAIPVAYRNQLVGYILFHIVHQSGTWTEEDMVLLRILGEMVGNALQRQQNEQEVIAQKQYLRQIIDTVPNIVFVKDAHGRLLTINQAFAKLMELPVDYILAEQIHLDATQINTSPAETEDSTLADYQVIAHRSTVITEEVYVHPISGRAHQLLSTRKPLLLPDGTIHVLGVAVDITERKQAEEKLRESEAQLREAQRISHLGSWNFDIPTGRITWSEEVFRIHRIDISHGEPSMQDLLLLYTEPEKLEECIDRAIHQGVPYHYDAQIKTPDGQIRYLQVIGKPDTDHLGRCVRLYGTIMDITARKQTEERLKHRLDVEKLLSSISTHFVNSASEELDTAIIYALEKLGLFARVDRAFVFRFDFEANTSSNTHEWYTAGLEPMQQRLQHLPLNRERWGFRKLQNFEPLLIKDLSEMPPEAEPERLTLEAAGVKSYISVPMGSKSNLLGYVGFFSTVHHRQWEEEDLILLKIVSEIFSNAFERRKVELELLHQKQFLRQVIDTAPNLIFVKNKQGEILLANQAMADLFETSLEKLIGRIVVFQGQDASSDRRVVENMESLVLEEYFTTLTGEEKFFLTTKKPIVFPDGSVNVMEIAVEITERKKAEEKLRQSEQLFHAVFNNSTDALFIVEADRMIIRDCNDIAVKMFAHQHKNELLGMQGYKKLQKRDFTHEQLRDIIAQLETTGGWHSEMEYYNANGDVFWGNLALKMFRVGSQNFQLVRVTDIDARKKDEIQRQRSEQLLQTIYNNSADALFLLSAETRLIEDCNSLALSMFGLKDKFLLINTDGSQLMKNGMSTEEAQMMRAYLEKYGTWDGEMEYRRQDDGTIFWGNMAVRRFEAGNRLLELVRITNITERKYAEAELIVAKEKAEEMNKLKSRFLANMSHEIRTPLNGILGMAQVIVAESQEETTREYAHIIEESGHRLLSTINDILDLSKIEAQKTEMQLMVHNVNDIVAKIAKSLKVLADRKNLQMHLIYLHPQVEALVDERLLEQILINLIGNAIKFTEQGHVRIVTETVILPTGEQTASIRVEDTGIGIAESYFPKLFTPFSQASSGHGRRFHGTGLGLSISKSFIELMGGRILVSSVEGKGSCFELQFRAE